MLNFQIYNGNWLSSNRIQDTHLTRICRGRGRSATGRMPMPRSLQSIDESTPKVNSSGGRVKEYLFDLGDHGSFGWLVNKVVKHNE